MYLYTYTQVFLYVKLINTNNVFLAEDRMNIVQQVWKESILGVRNSGYQDWWDVPQEVYVPSEKKVVNNIIFGRIHWKQESPNSWPLLSPLFFKLYFLLTLPTSTGGNSSLILDVKKLLSVQFFLKFAAKSFDGQPDLNWHGAL